MKKVWYSPFAWLSLLAAILYCSWPLGYFLDPSVEKHSLASELAAPHHPHYAVFIATDVLAGAILMAVGLWQYFKHPVHQASRAIIISYLLFGFLVIVAALTPLACDPTTQHCGPLIHNYRILVHGAASILSVVCLLAALVGLTIKLYRELGSHKIVWGLCGLLTGWLLFGVGSVGSMLLDLAKSNVLQDYFIALCSFTIVAVVGVIEFIAVRA